MANRTIDKIQYTDNGTYYSVSGYETGITEANILAEVDGKPVTNINSYVFENCTDLTSVTIGSNVTSIGSYSFKNCTGITSVTIGNKVTSIGGSAFYGCIGLTNVIIPNSVTSIGNSAFYTCTGLTSITIGNNVTSIGHYAFSYCTGLTSIIIPDSVTNIYSFAFYGCTGFTNITIPDNIINIDASAFALCTGLTSIIILAKTPPTLGSSALPSTSNIKIYVPKNSIPTYKSTTNWSDYADVMVELQIDTIQTSNGNSFAIDAKYDDEGNVIKDTYAKKSYVDSHHDNTKQDKLTAGQNITIDPVTNVISATRNKKYELIETITIQGTDINTVYRDKEPNGQSYNFEIVKIFVENGGTGSTSKQFRVSLNGDEVVYVLEGSTPARNEYIYLDVSRGLLNGWYYNPKQFYTTSSPFYSCFLRNEMKYYDNISSLQFATQPSLSFEQNTKITIYGVRK